MSPTSYQTAPPRINNLVSSVSSTKAAHYRDGPALGQGPKPLNFKLFLSVCDSPPGSSPQRKNHHPATYSRTQKRDKPFGSSLFRELHPIKDQMYFTSSISYSTSPPGVRISATSPTSLPIRPRAMGELTEILLDFTSASSSPTIL